LPDALDADIFAISDSRPSRSFLSQCHVVSQLDNQQEILTASASYLGSQPSATVVAVVDRTANISNAARSIARSRRFFHGHSHYAPDIVLVSEWVANELIAHLVREVATPFTATKRLQPSANGHANGHAIKPRSQIALETMKNFEGLESTKVIISGENGGIVEVTSR
jgi:aldehyde dehydrogenase (NAD+)